MLDTDTIQALCAISDANPWDFTQTPTAPRSPRTCDNCNQPAHVRVSTGVRWVCLDCATTLTQAAEQRGAVPA